MALTEPAGAEGAAAARETTLPQQVLLTDAAITLIDRLRGFILATVGSGNQVSLLSWQGLFSAQMGGGNDVYANRPQVGDWETWTFVDNNDGTVSFKSSNGNYLSAQGGGGDGMAVYVNRTTVGDWERFYLVNLPDGRVALKTHDKGKFVSVQQ